MHGNNILYYTKSIYDLNTTHGFSRGSRCMNGLSLMALAISLFLLVYLKWLKPFMGNDLYRFLMAEAMSYTYIKTFFNY